MSDSDVWLNSSEFAARFSLSQRHTQRILKDKRFVWNGQEYLLTVEQRQVGRHSGVFFVLASSLPKGGRPMSQLLGAGTPVLKVKESVIPALESPSVLAAPHQDLTVFDNGIFNQDANHIFNFQPFVDWLTISQDHPVNSIPKLYSGEVVAIDVDGNIEPLTYRRFPAVGSHDTRIFLMSDGQKVTLSGNVSGFGRPDNVFGLNYPDAIRKSNAVLKEFGLPPFTVGEFYVDGSARACWTGAQLHRIDLTYNFALSTAFEKDYLMRNFSFTRLDRMSAEPYSSLDGSLQSVYWGTKGRSGKASEYYVFKVYDKASQFKFKNRIRLKDKDDDYIHELSKFLTSLNVLRFELGLKRKMLNTYSGSMAYYLKYKEVLGDMFMKRFNAIFAEHGCDREAVARLHAENRQAYNTFISWRDGLSLLSSMSKATFYRHRKIVKDYLGIDISIPFDPKVIFLPNDMNTKTRLYPLNKKDMPKFYEFDEFDTEVNEIERPVLKLVQNG